jgi:hypothetical protein
MNHPALHQGTYTAGRRTLEYWTRCEHCTERKVCRHTCDHPGWMRFYVGGRRSVFWSGIITLRKIAATVRDYLERDEAALPDDVYVPPRQMRLEEATCSPTGN